MQCVVFGNVDELSSVDVAFLITVERKKSGAVARESDAATHTLVEPACEKFQCQCIELLSRGV